MQEEDEEEEEEEQTRMTAKWDQWQKISGDDNMWVIFIFFSIYIFFYLFEF